MKRLASLATLATLATLAGGPLSCAGPQQPAVEVIRHDELNVDGEQRLGEAVVPTGYDLDLRIDPAAERFSGESAITVQIAEPRRIIRLHADESLNIAEATVTPGDQAAGEQMEAEVVRGENDGIALVLPKPVPAGEATLRFRYDAPLDEVPEGLYRVKEGEAWYAFSQLEPLEARAVFPAFDEPRFKTPYTTTLRVPAGLVAATNAPQTEVTQEGAEAVHRFATTKPLPTYLVAFAVGPFDVVEAPADAIAGVPLRLLATKGKGALGAEVLARTPAILAALTDYFGRPYPYAKLDLVAVPNFAAGAMENVGLVTFRETLLLLDSKTASVADRRAALSVMAHELAHMWFGNLVTPPWWDELWLNESFATWMARRVVQQLEPELDAEIDAVGSKGWVMGVDAQAEARAIRQPIVDSGDVYNAFDGITYTKGAAVLEMFEAWVGEEAFREGVRAYLEANAGGSGTSASLMAALEEASGKPVGAAMQAFLDQPGTPLLDVALSCEGEAPVVSVRQSRYLPAGSTASQGGPWRVPMCVRYEQAKGGSAVHCELIEGAEAQFTLPTTRCPRWIYPNADEAGYYRWKLDEAATVALVKAHRSKLTTAEKVGLASNLDALIEAEALPASTMLEVTEALAKERHRALVRRVIGDLYGIRDVVPDEALPRYRRLVSRLLADDLKRVGMTERPKDSAQQKLLRPRLISAMAWLGEDPKVIAHAREVTDRFLKAMKEVPVDQADVALPIAARFGEPSLWLSYKMALGSAPTPAARSAILGGLASFREPKLVEKSLGLLLDGTLRAQDFWAIVGPTMDDPQTFAVTWEWFTTNYDAIVALLGEKSAPRLPSVGRGFCSAEGRAKVEAFFGDKATPGAARNLANTLERIDRCVRWRDYVREDVAAFLK